MSQIKFKAICIFYNRGEILVAPVIDAYLNKTFYRPLGGSIEFDESSIDAIRREIKEELQADIINPTLVGSLESRFNYEGQAGHEFLQVYDAAFVDKSIYLMPSIPFQESDGTSHQAIWKDLTFFNEQSPLVPTGLLALIQRNFLLSS